MAADAAEATEWPSAFSESDLLPARSRNRRRRLRVHLARWRRLEWRRATLAVVVTALVIGILAVPLRAGQVDLHLGDLAPENYIAPRHVRFVDQDKTDTVRRYAEVQVSKQYTVIDNAEEQALATVVSFFRAAARVRDDASLADLEARITALRQTLPASEPPAVTDLALRAAFSIGVAELQIVEAECAQIVSDLMSQELADDTDALATARDGIPLQLRGKTNLAPNTSRLARAVISGSLIENRLYDASRTDELRRDARDRVDLQYTEVKRGDLIARRGEAITADHLRTLRELGLVRAAVDPLQTWSLVGLAIGVVAFFCLFLQRFHLRTYENLSQLFLLSIIGVVGLLSFRVLTSLLQGVLTPEQIGFLAVLCASLSAMLVASLVNPQAAVFVGVSMTLLVGVIADADLTFAVIGVVASLIGVVMVSKIRSRADILRTGLLLALTNVGVGFLVQGARGGGFEMQIVRDMSLWGGMGGAIAVILFWPLTALLERPFRLTTTLTLLELSDPNHPLVRRLQMEAPGTYHHSIIVGNLAEAAANAIGADGLFARVASYYHDIGKVVRPYFFVENQTSVNRHTEINPSLSALVITSHVKDGVEMAEEHRLPRPIIDIIKEHHGTCLIKYFYHRAVTASEATAGPALEYQFRYDGPRPRTKESGIIMLADATEAASRVLEKPTPTRIRELIDNIVRDRLADGQMEECELTFKDLETISASLARSMASQLHARVEYPQEDTSALTRLAADGSGRKQSLEARTGLSDTPEPSDLARRGTAGG